MPTSILPFISTFVSTSVFPSYIILIVLSFFRILIPKCPQILLYIFGVLTTNTCSITFEDIDVIIVNCLPCSYDTTIIFTIATFFIIIITT